MPRKPTNPPNRRTAGRQSAPPAPPPPADGLPRDAAGVVRWFDHSQIFAGPRPASVRRGLEPAFLLFETEVMEALQERAARRGLAYDALVRMIVREHVDEY